MLSILIVVIFHNTMQTSNHYVAHLTTYNSICQLYHNKEENKYNKVNQALKSKEPENVQTMRNKSWQRKDISW